MSRLPAAFILFFFNDTATTEIYTLSLHDALPICAGAGQPLCGRDGCGYRRRRRRRGSPGARPEGQSGFAADAPQRTRARSEEHTSELQSPCNLVCRLLLEKKKNSACATSSSRRAA